MNSKHPWTAELELEAGGAKITHGYIARSGLARATVPTPTTQEPCHALNTHNDCSLWLFSTIEPPLMWHLMWSGCG